MKQWIILFWLIILFSCRENQKGLSVPPLRDSLLVTNAVVKDSIPQALYKSELSLGKAVPLEKVFTDTVTFVERDDNGDYFLFNVRKNNRQFSLMYDDLVAQHLDFLRGDTLVIQWKMDSLFIAGEGDKLDFGEWLVSVKKIKDSKVAAFRKMYTRPIKYWHAKDIDYTDDFKDYLYHLVEYYIAYSQKPLLLLHLRQPSETDFVYSIEERQEKDRHYTVLGLSDDQGTHSTIIQWLYLDSESRILYEYDLASDQLIPFPGSNEVGK